MLNHLTIMGRLTADPELRHTQSDIPVTSFRIAVELRGPGGRGQDGLLRCHGVEGHGRNRLQIFH